MKLPSRKRFHVEPQRWNRREAGRRRAFSDRRKHQRELSLAIQAQNRVDLPIDEPRMISALMSDAAAAARMGEQL